MPLTLTGLRALEILDSRGNPTVAVRCELSDGTSASAQVPSGASTGKHEAVELRDGEMTRYAGKGVRRAVENVHQMLWPALKGMAAEDLRAVDRRMLEVDGTPDKSRAGANAILGVSCAVARALSISRREPLWQTLGELFPGERRASLPVPMVNILSGGLHAERNIEFQDFLVMAGGFDSVADAMVAIVEVHRTVRRILEERGIAVTGVADEGGWGPILPSNEAALEILAHSIERAGYHADTQMSIALDVASSHFYREGIYHLTTEGVNLDSDGMIGKLEQWCGRYPIRSIEDGLEEDDWPGWTRLTERLGGKVQLVGDDFFTTNPDRVRRGISERAGNAVLVKMNQIGTLTETFEVIDTARQAGFGAVISARSGETEDSFLADLAVASGAGQIKVGSITRSERLAKYNRLLEIEADSDLPYAGASASTARLPQS
jgi:enolase